MAWRVVAGRPLVSKVFVFPLRICVDPSLVRLSFGCSEGGLGCAESDDAFPDDLVGLGVADGWVVEVALSAGAGFFVFVPEVHDLLNLM